MKIVLSEQQICELVILEGLDNSSDDLLTENFNLNNLKMKIKRLLIAGVAASSILFTIDKIQLNMSQKAELKAFIQMENEKIEQERIKQDSICNAKIEACEKYMTKALANQGFNRDSTKLTAEALVKTAGEYSFDLPLLMAAAHLESCFGATNRAQKTNSVYSVGAYDNGKNVVSYTHPNESIAGYINLLRSDYLINGKTIDDLLKPGGFINKNGHRYASKKNYEALLKSIRNKIITQYPELV